VEKKRVLFLCIGNACRSQMAEGFARAYGADVIEPCSAGLGPASSMPPLTIQTMQEKNIDLSQAFPKGLDLIQRDGIDLIVNLTGSPLPTRVRTPVENWDIRDPIGQSEKTYRQVRDEIESRVMNLIMVMRAEHPGAQHRTAPTAGKVMPADGSAPSRFDMRRSRFRQ
jgi:arsenate reductase (thioredoxin)